MSATRIAMLLTAIGYVALVVGCALVATWLALIVGGAALIGLGFSIEEPKPKRKAGQL